MNLLLTDVTEIFLGILEMSYLIIPYILSIDGSVAGLHVETKNRKKKCLIGCS